MVVDSALIDPAADKSDVAGRERGGILRHTLTRAASAGDEVDESAGSRMTGHDVIADIAAGQE